MESRFLLSCRLRFFIMRGLSHHYEKRKTKKIKHGGTLYERCVSCIWSWGFLPGNREPTRSIPDGQGTCKQIWSGCLCLDVVAGTPIFQAFSTGVVKRNLVIKYYKYYQISDDIFGEYTVINYLNITLIRANIHTTKGKGNEKK